MLANILCVLLIDGSAGCFISDSAEMCSDDIVKIHEALDDELVMATCDPIKPRVRPIARPWR